MYYQYYFWGLLRSISVLLRELEQGLVHLRAIRIGKQEARPYVHVHRIKSGRPNDFHLAADNAKPASLG